jgi:peptide/nickel transport system substrate-binding protein
MRTIDRTLWSTRKDANEIQVTVHRFEDYWWQGNNRSDIWASEWNKYYESNGEEGIEPPEDVNEFLDLANSVRSDSVEVGIEAFEKLQAANRENLYFLVTNQNAQQPQIVNARLGNIPNEGTGIAMNFSAEQFFFTGGEE